MVDPEVKSQATPTGDLSMEGTSEVAVVGNDGADDTAIENENPDTAVEIVPDQDEDDGHQSWGSKFSYILTLVGYAVGFGNIWRFPFLIQDQGGAAFLIPYTIMLILVGIPSFFLELAVGQRLRKGPLGSWTEITPFLSGLGLVSGMVCILVGLYYTSLIGYCLAYLFDSFREHLRYSNCGYAVQNKEGFCDNMDNSTASMMNEAKLTYKEACRICQDSSASQYYWNHEMLKISPSIEEPGLWNWWIMLYVVIAWLLIWAILVKGIKATGKVVYFTALFPYVVLTIFLIFALTLEGMEDGYRVLFSPKWEKLTDGTVWQKAGAQIFFSLGVGFGSLIVFASYLPSDNDCYKDAVYVSVINCSTSLFASITIFPILGYAGTLKYRECKKLKAKLFKIFVEKNKLNPNFTLAEGNLSKYETCPIKNVVLNGIDTALSITWEDKIENRANGTCIPCNLDDSIKSSGSGPSLVYIAFADAIVHLPGSQFWAVLFFTMLLTLGIDSGFGTVEGGVSVILDLFKSKKHGLVTSIYCAVSCACSMIFCLGWGQYVISLCDTFAVDWCLLIIVFFQCVGISWIYGLKQFSYDIKLMTGRRPNIYMLLCWKAISPLIIFVLFFVSIYQYFAQPQQYTSWNKDEAKSEGKDWPAGAIAIGFMLILIVGIWIPLLAVLAKFKIYIIKPEVAAYFPEDELRDARNIVSDYDEAKHTTPVERMMYWGQDELRRTSRTPSQVQIGQILPNSSSAIDGLHSAEGDIAAQSGADAV